MPNEEKVWTNEEIIRLWPSAAEELRGFQNALQARAGLTASQLGMGLQLATMGFNKVTSSGGQWKDQNEQIPSEIVDKIEALLDYTITTFNRDHDTNGIVQHIGTFDRLWCALKTAREKAGRPEPKLRR